MDGAIEGARRVGGTAAGEYRELAPDVLVAVPRPDYVQTAAGARASIDEMNRIAESRGRRQGLLVLVDRVHSQDGESRKVWQKEMNPTRIGALALVCDSLLARAIGSFFIGIRQPSVPTAMVASVEEGVAFVQRHLLTATARDRTPRGRGGAGER